MTIKRDYVSFDKEKNNMTIQQNSINDSQDDMNHKSKINFVQTPVQELSSKIDETAVKKMVEE